MYHAADILIRVPQDMPFTLEEILSDQQQLRTVQLHDTVPSALNIMHHHGYSQLPVVDRDGRTSKGQVVTFEGILQRVQSFRAFPEMFHVRDVARTVRTYAPDADLLSTLDDIQRDNFALIVDDENAVMGIVTTADTTLFFREYAEDLMLIEGIESRMKEAITALYAADDTALETAIARVTDRAADIRKKLPVAIRGYLEKAGLKSPVGSDVAALAEAEKRLGLPKAGKAFDRLSFDEIAEVLLAHAQSPRIGKAQGCAEMRMLLQQVRDARNKLAHFRGELHADERRHIHVASEWLEQNLPVPAVAVAPIVSVPKSGISAPHDEEDIAPQGSYGLLSKYLGSQTPGMTSCTVSFHDLEKVLGKELPRSAYEYRAWWANDPTKPQSAAWLDEGWRTTALSMTNRRLTFVRTSDREHAYIAFFAELNKRLSDVPGFPLRNVSPGGQSWNILASIQWGKPEAANINAAFAHGKQMRIEFYLDNGNREQTKSRFNELLLRKGEVEQAFGEPLHWERLDHARACRVALYTKAQILTDSENVMLIEWPTKNTVDFQRVFAPIFVDLKSQKNSEPHALQLPSNDLLG